MKTGNIFAGLAVIAGFLTAQTESSARLNKLLQKANILVSLTGAL